MGKTLNRRRSRLTLKCGQRPLILRAPSPDADLIAAADALEAEGDVTDVIETDSGLYVARLTSLLDRDATDQEKQNIVEQRRQDQYDSLLEDWRDAADITVNEKVWAKVDLRIRV